MSYENYHRFLQALAAAVQDEADADAQVAFTGLRGTGKSTFTLGATMRLEKYLGGEWSLEQNVLWTYREIMRGLTDESPSHAIAIDEAVLVALNRNFGRSWQKKLVQLLNTAREYHKISFWNIPMFRRLDPGVREQFQYWVWIPRRGEALVFQRSVNPAAKDPWNLDYMEWYIRQRAKNDWNVDEVVEAAMEVPNFSMYFKFPKVDEKIRRAYKEIAKKMKKRLDADEEEDESVQVVDGARADAVLATKLAMLAGASERSAYRWVQQYMREFPEDILVEVRGAQRRYYVKKDAAPQFIRWIVSRVADSDFSAERDKAMAAAIASP